MSDKIEALIKKISKQPRNDIVPELIGKGDIDSLTQFRLKLVEKGKQFETFPKGDPYTRRKPKGCSKFSTLEERLANDICEIHEYFNTGVVTMGLKDMFKNENGSSDLSVVSESGVVNTIHWCSDAEAGAEKPLSQVTPSQADGLSTPGEARKCWKSRDLTQSLTDSFCQVNSNSHPATKTKHSDEKMSCKDILILVKNMRAELLAVREECAESVKIFENKVNELNSVLEARNSKIQTLKTEISSLKGQSKAIHERFKEEIKGNTEELTSLKGKVETVGNKVSNTSRDPDRIKKKQHQGHGESNLSKRKSSKNPVAEPQSIDANPSKHGKGADPVENNRKPDTQEVETLKTTTVKKILVQKDREQAEITQGGGQLNAPNESGNKVTGRNTIHENNETNNVNDVQFVGVERQRIKRVFLGGIRAGVSSEKIREYMMKRNINPTFVRLMQSKRKGTTSVRINVVAKDFDVVKETPFWPEGVYARPWLSLAKWQDRLSTKEPQLLDSSHRSKSETNST